MRLRVVLATTTGSGVPQLPGEPRLPLLLLLKDPALGSRCGRKRPTALPAAPTGIDRGPATLLLLLLLLLLCPAQTTRYCPPSPRDDWK
ncbi:unnamed protein product [Arctogadus glacialis]